MHEGSAFLGYVLLDLRQPGLPRKALIHFKVFLIVEDPDTFHELAFLSGIDLDDDWFKLDREPVLASDHSTTTYLAFPVRVDQL